MQQDPNALAKRPVLVQTVHGPVEGWMHINERTRTTDHLNLTGESFVTVEITERPFPDWPFEKGVLEISTASVLFVTERDVSSPMTDARVEANRYTRAAVRLRLGEYDIQGFMHISALSDPMVRLKKNRQPFVALTAASVLGPDAQFGAGYLAVNPRHILAVQQIHEGDPMFTPEAFMDESRVGL